MLILELAKVGEAGEILGLDSNRDGIFVIGSEIQQHNRVGLRCKDGVDLAGDGDFLTRFVFESEEIRCMDGLFDNIGIWLNRAEFLVLHSDDELRRLWGILWFLSNPMRNRDESGDADCRYGDNRGERCVHSLILSVWMIPDNNGSKAHTVCTASRNCVIIQA